MFARSGEAGRRRPRIVIAHSNPAFTSAVDRAFRRHGWVVATAADGPEARRLATLFPTDLVVLETERREESGWLTCAKLNLGGDRPAVVLVSRAPVEGDAEFAEFAGAVRLVTPEEGVEPLLEEAGLAAPVRQVI
ncbi:MAG TPA: response regulator [Gemmataceae bacterium]|nr:response regulator [Gemmataceae bacterium]